MKKKILSNITDILKNGIKQYGFFFLIKLLIYELINLYKFRYYDYINLQKYEDDLEPCVPSPYFILNIFSKKLKKEFNNSTFIDFGSGKGRVISYVKNENFKKIIGIEINKKLNNYLNFNQNNIIIYNKDCRDINFINKLINENYDEKIIMYFYHPFSIELINKIIERFINKRENIYIVVVGKIIIETKLKCKLNILYENKMLQIFNY